MQECIIYNVAIDDYINPLKIKIYHHTETTATPDVTHLRL